MGQPSPLDEQGIDVLEGQIRECFGRVVYSHKTHEKCADIYHRRLTRLKTIQIVLSAMTTAGLLGTVFGMSYWATVLATITSTILLAINAYTKQTDLGELSQKHASIAGRLWDVRESFLSLLADMRIKAIDVQQVREIRDRLQKNLFSIYQSAPRTTSDAYSLAQGALKVNEELTFSDREIDLFLPKDLRRTKE
jgi:hypothetical protein